MAVILSGIDHLSSVDSVLKGQRLGLMTNQTGIDRQFRSTINLLHEQYHLTALFAVEHGIRGNVQGGLHLQNEIDPQTGVPVYSVYGDTRRMTQEMLDAFDVFCFDIQDVGLRFYTFIYALSYAMEACHAAGKQVVVFDRVNSLGGDRVDGTLLDEAFASYVGMYAMPTQYGMTVGEYARWCKDYLHLDGLKLTVVPLSGWNRRDDLSKLDLPWVAPSPNCTGFAAAYAYAGGCIFEGVNVSEGRGTCMPFEYYGAPWIDAVELEKQMGKRNLPGLHFRATYFTPTFSKYQGQMCQGVQMHIVDHQTARPILGALCLLDEIRLLYPDKLEFNHTLEGKPTMDLLLGTDEYRRGVYDGPGLLKAHEGKVEAFRQARKPYLLYD